MPDKKLKVIILTHGGAERFLELLAAVAEVEIVGIFVETATVKERPFAEKVKRSIRYDGYFATVNKLASKFLSSGNSGSDDALAIEKGQDSLAECAARLSLPISKVADYHSEESIALLKAAKADLGILYGTNIVRESVFGIPKLGSINIHQGLAPLYRGGPTVFWELLNGEKEVGITVHFVAAKVDTGDIVLQKTVPLDYDFNVYGFRYDEFLNDFRASMKEPSAQLLVEAVRQIAAGKEQRTKQDTSLGKRYRLPVKTEKDQLLSILKKRHEGGR
ncbi:MAG: formyltransferase family protein [Pyrinomonadaceae bacterium]